MIVEISKKRVIQILKKEKLVHGVFGSPYNDPANGWPSRRRPSRRKASHRACAMCAVGQVVRAAMSTDVTIDRVSEIAGEQTNRKLWLGLSDVFEASGRYLDVDTGTGRKAAIEYVKERFPATVRIDIGDAKPRRGMKVVKR